MSLGIEKLDFLNVPTPLHRLDRMSEYLGIDLWMKRDDLTNYGTGGNKLRKLEYLVKDALDKKATMLLTVGGAQTNHGRLTAAVAARYGLKCAIVTADPYPGEMSANLLLDGLFDCHVYFAAEAKDKDWGQRLDETVELVTKEWESRGEKVYFIPMGGSNELGALGYYDCALEIHEQLKHGSCAGLRDPRLITTVGSFGTYAGLLLGIENKDLDIRLTGVGIMPYENMRSEALEHYERARAAFGLEKVLREEELDLVDDCHRGGYNNPLPEVRKAIELMARKEGIILDPCYTGKTFLYICEAAERGDVGREESVIMLHTGGIPGIYTKHHRVEFERELEDHMHRL